MFYFNVKSIYSTEDYAYYYNKIKKTLFLISLNLFNKKIKIFDNFKKDFIYFEMYFRKILTRIYYGQKLPIILNLFWVGK